MSALGFDIGTNCGWAARLDGCYLYSDSYECGLLKLPGGRFPGDGLRAMQFEAELLKLIDTYKPDHIYYELVRAHRGVDAAHVYGALRGTLTKVCEQKKIPYTGIPVGTIKKFATGNGGAKKPAMVATAKAKWPTLKIQTDDVADSLWVLATGLHQSENPQDTTCSPNTRQKRSRKATPKPASPNPNALADLTTRLNLRSARKP